MRPTLLVKLLLALVVPAVALFTLFAFVAYEVSRRDLDDELGRRLEAIAASAATQVRGKYLTELAPGDENARAYQNVEKKLEAVAQATGAQLFVFDRQLDARADTAGGIAIGTHYFRAELDRREIARVFERGETASSVTFEGGDGKIYKAGYAPVRASETDNQIVLVLGAQAPASYFDRLDDLRGRLLRWGAGLAAVSIAAAVLATLLITRNVRKLAAAAERIGAGDLQAPVVIRSRDELGVLAQTMDRMRQQLAERDARMQQMLAGIAHEVRNPLAGMTLFAGLLRDELPADDDRRSHVLRIERELGYLDRVVTQFLEYARRPALELTTMPVGELLAEVADITASDAIAVRVIAPDAALEVLADRGQLRRALLNLAHNAVHATTGGHPVELRARRAGDDLVIEVANHGAEIPADQRERVFEPFFTTREQGTGLGLSFVREIARAHGGTVNVTCADGVTTFAMVLPAATPLMLAETP